MYELEEHDAEVAEQIATPPRRAVFDYEAAITHILSRPYDADLVDRRPGRHARRRYFGLGFGSIVYTPRSSRRRVQLEMVRFLHSVP